MMSRRDFCVWMGSILGFSALARGAWATPEAALQAFELSNDQMKASWRMGANAQLMVTGAGGHRLHAGEPFTLLLKGGSQLRAHDMTVIAARAEAHQATIRFKSTDGRLQLDWQVMLAAEAHYLRMAITLRALKDDISIEQIRLLGPVAAKPSGTVRGCPVITDTAFYGFEHPLAEIAWEGERASLLLPRGLPLRKGKSVRYGAVIGVAPSGQLRRAFNAYIEQTRPRKTRPFLHYNSWYDLGFSDIRFDEAGALGVIGALQDKLTEQRGVKLQSFLMDDGWDDPKSLWDFHDGFPNGFKAVAEKARAAGAALGVWMSPWGGYGNEKAERLRYGARQGFETNKDGFALSGKKYYARFRDACLRMIREFGVNQFKLDGMGDVNSSAAGSAFDSDFDAAIGLITELRHEKADLYVNLTYGTFASPFWLHYADSIWRGGKDHDHAGQGTKRQQWITYRDADTYENVVKKCSLFPLHSLMLHGIIFAQHTPHLKSDPFGDFTAEVRSFFASGTQLQELYITPALLQDTHWDALAQGASFAREHTDLLHDTHWVGGNPLSGEVYGWAAWNTMGALLTLRNPTDKEQSFIADLQQLWELPDGATTDYTAHDAWDETAPAQNWNTQQPVTVTLAPFAVQSFVARPQ